MKEDLLKLADLLRELVDQVSYNASSNALQSFPQLTLQIEKADVLRKKVDALRMKLAESVG